MPLPVLNLLLFAGEALAASLILPALGWASCLLLRERAAMRHLVWLSVFGALLSLPLLALLVPPQTIVQQAAPMAMAYDPPPVAMSDATSGSFWMASHIMMALAGLWAAGFFWNLLRLSVGFYGLRRLRRISLPFDAGVECEVRLAQTVPLTFGWWKSVILLPLDAPSWPRERLDAVLGHEQAHVRRHDNLSHGLALLACAFYWPNPFLWMAHDAMCRDAEIAADNCVLAGDMKPSAYAAELLKLAAEYHGRAPFAALAMASPSSLETRVTSLLSSTQSRKGVTGMEASKIAGLGLAAALVLAFARPGIAEAQSPAPLQIASFTPAMPDMPKAAGQKINGVLSQPNFMPERKTDDRAMAQAKLWVSSPNAENRSQREIRLKAERITRDAFLKEKAAQRQVTLDVKFEQSRIARELALGIKTAERVARLAQQKADRDASHTQR